MLTALNQSDALIVHEELDFVGEVVPLGIIKSKVTVHINLTLLAWHFCQLDAPLLWTIIAWLVWSPRQKHEVAQVDVLGDLDDFFTAVEAEWRGLSELVEIVQVIVVVSREGGQLLRVDLV